LRFQRITRAVAVTASLGEHTSSGQREETALADTRVLRTGPFAATARLQPFRRGVQLEPFRGGPDL